LHQTLAAVTMAKTAATENETVAADTGDSPRQDKEVESDERNGSSRPDGSENIAPDVPEENVDEGACCPEKSNADKDGQADIESDAKPDVQTKKKVKTVGPDSFMKVCELLQGRKVVIHRQPQPAENSAAISGTLRKAQGRSSVKILNDDGDVVLIRLQDILALEASDGTRVELDQTAQPAAAAPGTRSGGYKQDDGDAADKKEMAGREKYLCGGLKYEVERVGPAGSRRAQIRDRVQVYYDGRLAKTGGRFDKGMLTFQLGTRAVIKGFDVGVEGMAVGEKRKVTIPFKMAYGSEGSPPKIPPRADLIFTIELQAIQ